MNDQEPRVRGRLLVVDDEPAIVDTVARFLRFVGYEVRTAATGREALALAREFLPDLVLLDIMLPDSDGFEVLSRLRADGLPVAVVFLTARDTRKDLVRGLTAGGDDYITKPFGLDEVAARVGAVLRRTRAHRPDDPSVQVADLSLNTLTHEVRRAGAVIDLSPTEFRLLRYLMLHQGKVITRARLLEHVWSYDFNGDDTVVATYISYLRRKVDSHGERLIHTHRGVGYSLRAAEC
ncbi:MULTISPECIES: response regulator transcription factor [Streptomyces]|uniref:Response regulator transcription factor n=1 Tax=Streptomyces phaeochromogenes TaxID=1923 RepID=A0ABZ1HNC2_STRPH|nr:MULTISPECIES: response regulator transcription factor [Streptomyces phaeochromogenes group]MCR3723911.1 two-component system OmpR family response regulator [Streptomyces umbrinus]WRZ34882.1 response regulator transcription factor [Streptomyces phaeochromogenes]WSD20115.1 response regulator transcription factor [Streptomyces phaeochromogenes]WSJ03214.1 response regulator transcription factor [Streptomyces phaeochromogenes]GHB31323.1 DNA-binding response regulator [Streptomyces umbrinus]